MGSHRKSEDHVTARVIDQFHTKFHTKYIVGVRQVMETGERNAHLCIGQHAKLACIGQPGPPMSALLRRNPAAGRADGWRLSQRRGEVPEARASQSLLARRSTQVTRPSGTWELNEHIAI